MPVREKRRFLASSPIIIPGYASSESSASPRDLSPMVSGTDPIVTIPASPTRTRYIICRASLYRPVASPAKEAAENVVGASQIVGAAKVAETLGAAPEAKEAAENAVEASQIV